MKVEVIKSQKSKNTYTVNRVNDGYIFKNEKEITIGYTDSNGIRKSLTACICKDEMEGIGFGR